MGNSLKMKLFNQIRLVDPTRATNGINAIIAAGNYIQTSAQDFQFQYSSGITPVGQHPLYVDNYWAGVTHYQSNYLINKMQTQNDPRIRYYMYRQSLDDPTGTDVPCDAIDCFYGYQGNGYIGRDHGDPSGIPNDNEIRTVFGVYPAAGLYDDGTTNATVSQLSSSGAGIHPMLTSWQMKFIEAEAALTLGTTGDPRQLMLDGINEQMDVVFAFGSAVDANAPAAASVDRDFYINGRTADYDAATTDEERLQQIMTEKHVAQFGMGYESFNDYRRTGFPRFVNQILQDGSTTDYPENTMSISPQGAYPRRLLYPDRELQTNTNAPAQQARTTPVFWDNN